MDKITRDRMTSIIFFALGMLIIFAVPTYISASRNDDVLGSKFVPYVSAVVMVLFSVILFISTFLARKNQPSKEKNHSLKSYFMKDLKVIVYLLLMFIGVQIMQIYGFIVGTLLITTGTLLLLKVKKPIWYVIVYIILLAIYLIFTFAFKIKLP